MKAIFIILIVLFAALQYKLWIADGGVRQLWHMQDQVETVIARNEKAKQLNQALSHQIKRLKTEEQAIEARARRDLNMVKRGEAFYQVIEQPKEQKL